MSSHPRLTKKRIKALEVELSFDDLLYEKFRRLSQDLAKREAAFARRKQVCEVVHKLPSGIHKVLQIIDVEKSYLGTRVIVR